MSKAGKAQIFAMAVARDLWPQEGIAHHFFTAVEGDLGVRIQFVKVDIAFVEPSALQVRKTCHESEAVCCMFSRLIHDKCMLLYIESMSLLEDT